MAITSAITHVMEPVLPGTCTVLTVGHAGDDPRVYALPLADGPTSAPGVGAPPVPGAAVPLRILQRRGECLTVEAPAGPFSALAVQLGTVFDPATAWIANRPRLDWGWPSAAAPGAEYRVHGRQLVSPEHYPTVNPADPVSYGGLLTGKTRIVARRRGEQAITEVPVRAASAYEAHLQIPAELPAGDYELFAHNGRGGVLGWSAPLPLTVRVPAPWPTTVFRVDDFLDVAHDVDAAIAAALAQVRAHGGGVLEFGVGVYALTQTIVVPRHTVVRGAGADHTLLHLPSGGGPLGPWVAITGDGDFAVEDLRLMGVYAAKLIVAPTLLPESFTAALNAPFTWAPVRAANVAIRRCHLEQAPGLSLDRRGDRDPAYREWLRQWYSTGTQGFEGFAGVHLKGDDLVIEDTTIVGAGSCVMLCGCTHVRVSRNLLKTGTAGHGFYAIGKLLWPADFATNPAAGGATIRGNYCARIIFEDNVVTAYSERARDLVYFIYGAEECHVARNRIGELQPNTDAEGLAFHLWSAKWPTTHLVMEGPTTGRIVDPQGEVTRECLDGAIVEILDGPGVGQNRRVLARHGDQVTLDRPWLVPPDDRSLVVYCAPPPFQRMTLVGNVITRTGANILLWGNSHDVVVDGNTARNPGFISVWSVRLEPNQKVWGGAAFTQVINNTSEMSWVTPRPGQPLLPQVRHAGISNPCSWHPDAPALGYDFLGLLIRGNCGRNQSCITYANRLATTATSAGRPLADAGVVIEQNYFADCQVGVVVEEGSAVVMRNNRGENLPQPEVWAPAAG